MNERQEAWLNGISWGWVSGGIWAMLYPTKGTGLIIALLGLGMWIATMIKDRAAQRQQGVACVEV